MHPWADLFLKSNYWQGRPKSRILQQRNLDDVTSCPVAGAFLPAAAPSRQPLPWLQIFVLAWALEASHYKE